MAKHAYGAGIFYALSDIARKYQIPLDVVSTCILRAVLSEKYGFTCNCPQDMISMRRDSLLIVSGAGGLYR